ncbi:MAG: hypothetical protein HY717_12085 [Planctomycetes bacterium]|nr:hypothetical protein [Planctomycetota bacterium]
MKRKLFLAAAVGAMGAVGWAEASDPVGIYALVQKVVLEPNEDQPERLQVWGVFALAKDHGYQYHEPACGYLYYKLAAGKEEVCRAEWADLKKLAGTGVCLSFGGRYEEKGRVNQDYEKPSLPEAYPLGWGLQRARRGGEYSPVKNLLQFPLPVSPIGGEGVKPGKATLTVLNLQSLERKKAKYVFEIEKSTGEKEVSQPVAAGEKETRWSPDMEIQAGGRYTWRARAVEGEWKGPVVTATFTGKTASK